MEELRHPTLRVLSGPCLNRFTGLHHHLLEQFPGVADPGGRRRGGQPRRFWRSFGVCQRPTSPRHCRDLLDRHSTVGRRLPGGRNLV